MAESTGNGAGEVANTNSRLVLRNSAHYSFAVARILARWAVMVTAIAIRLSLAARVAVVAGLAVIAAAAP
jgi:hypothetical protein